MLSKHLISALRQLRQPRQLRHPCQPCEPCQLHQPYQLHQSIPISGHIPSRWLSDSSTDKRTARIADYDGVFDRIDNLVKADERVGKTGCVEYIFTLPAWKKIFTSSFILSLFGRNGSNSAANPYGHACIRYSYYQNLDHIHKIMNVSGQKNNPLINFLDPHKYMFTDERDIGNQQGGIINRSFLSVRVDNVDTEKIVKLDEYYKRLAEDNKNNKVQYGMILYTLTNWFRKMLGLPIKGNCSCWTGRGLAEIGMIDATSSWPLFLFFRVLFTQITRTSLENINVISYRSIRYHEEPKGALLYPFYWMKHSYGHIWNLGSIANIVVKPKRVELEELEESEKSNNHEQVDQVDQYVINIVTHRNVRYEEIIKKWLEIRAKMKRIMRFD